MSATGNVKTRKERLSVTLFRNRLLGLRKTSDSQGLYIYNDMIRNCSGAGLKGLGLTRKDPK
jgi:hypothetical protein